MKKSAPKKVKGIEQSTSGYTTKKPAKKASWQKQKVVDAVKNAKQHCTNPKNPSYPTYGGKGTKCLVTAAEVIAEIGLPKSKALSLDRINTHGNYEIGNIRWAYPSLQALNKKKTSATSSPEAELSEQQTLNDVRQQRKLVGELWDIGIRCHNQKFISDKDRKFLESLHFDEDVYDSNFKWDGPKDQAYLPGTFCMPSLTCPGERVKIRGGGWPPVDHQFCQLAIRNGVIRGLGFISADWNVPECEKKAVGRIFDSKFTGVVWTGNSSVGSLHHYPVEGRMLALASRICHVRGYSEAALCPFLKVSQLMEDASPNWISNLDTHPILTTTALFVPDVQVEMGIGWSPDALQAANFLKLLQYRRNQGLKTYIGVQNMARIPAIMRAYLARADEFERLFIGTYGTPQHPDPSIPPPLAADAAE